MPRSPLPCCIVVAALVLSNALPAAAQPTNPAKTTTAVTAPSAPVAVTASAGLAAEIDLSWSAPAPAPTGASTVARYIVQRGFSPSGAFATLFTTADATQTSFKDQGLPGSVSYHYRVVAVSSTGGQSPPSSPVKGTTAVATINDLGASPGVTSTSVSMTWSYVPGAAGYQVFKGPQGGPFTLIANLGSLVHAYTALSLSPGTPYAFVVKSRNGAVASSYSNELVYATLPDIPTGLVATASASSVSLTWTAAPVQAGILGYRIYRSTTAGGPYAQVGSVAGNVSTFPDSPGAGQRYYVIDATSISGASAKSAEATAVTGAAAPVAAGPSRGPDATKVSADGEMPRAGIRRPPPPERLPARR